MDIKNVHDVREWFEVKQTGKHLQTAIMKLAPKQASSETAESHEKCDQMLLVFKGEVEAEVEGETRIMREGDFIMVAAGTKHKFTNKGTRPAITLNSYSPPEY
jgi:mannose-6-phosphate isomerase-like protein (cupin superfamily)